MSGGIRYRPNPTERRLIEEVWPLPKGLSVLSESSQVQVRPGDPETFIQVEDLGTQTQFTLVMPLDDNADPKDGRLYFHDRFWISHERGLLEGRKSIFSYQGVLFPQGPDWLLGKSLIALVNGDVALAKTWNGLLRRLKGSPENPTEPANPYSGWLLQFHRNFPKSFISTLGKNKFIYQNDFNILEKYRLQMRFLEPQSGFSQFSEESRRGYRITVVIDRPSKSGPGAENNGRIFLHEDWELSKDGSSVMAFSRQFETTGDLSKNMERCLAELQKSEPPSLENPQVALVIEDLVKTLVPESVSPSGQAEKSQTDSEVEVSPQRKSLAVDPATKDLAKHLLHYLDKSRSRPNSPHTAPFKELLRLTLEDQPIDSSLIAKLQTEMETTEEGKRLLLGWTFLLQNDLELARKEWEKLPQDSAFSRQLEEGLDRLSKQKSALQILPLLQVTTESLQASRQHQAHDLTTSTPDFWNRLRSELSMNSFSLEASLNRMSARDDSEAEVLHLLKTHPLLQELLLIAEETRPKIRHRELQAWAKDSLIQKFGFYHIAEWVQESIPESFSHDLELVGLKTGQLSWGSTLELWQPHIMAAVFAPRNLLAMAAGATVGQTASRFMLARIPAGTKGALFAAETFSLLFEAPAFVTAGRAYDSFQSQGASMESPGFLRELGAAYLLFAPLKAARWGAHGSALRLSEAPWWKTHPRAVAGVESALTHSLGPLSLSLGNALSRSPWLEWQPQSPLGWQGNLVVDGLTYFHFLLGGAFAQAGLGAFQARPAGIPAANFRRTTPNTGSQNTPGFPGKVRGKTDGKAYLDFEMDLGRVQRPQLDTLAVLEGRIRHKIPQEDGTYKIQEEDLGSIPLKNDRNLWTFGRENEFESNLNVGLSKQFKQVSRRQGFFSVDESGRFSYTDLGTYGVRVNGRSVPTQVPIPLEPGTRLQFGLDNELEFEFKPQWGISHRTLSRGDLPESFEAAMNPPPRTKRHPAFTDLDDAQLQDYLRSVLTQQGPFRGKDHVRAHFGTLLANESQAYLLNGDRTVWFIGRQPEIGTPSDFMEKYMGVIRTLEAGPDVAAIHAVLYVTPEGKVAIQNLEMGRRLAVSFPQYGTGDYDNGELLGYSEPLEVPSWTYLDGPTRIILGENYLLDFKSEMITPLERSRFRPRNVPTYQEDTGEEILDSTDPAAKGNSTQAGSMPRWDQETLYLEGEVDLEVRPTQEWAGSTLTPDPKSGRPVLLIPTTEAGVLGARIYSTQAGKQRLFMITTLAPREGSGEGRREVIFPAFKTLGVDEDFHTLPQLGKQHAAFAMADGTRVRIGDFEFTVRIPEPK